MPNGKTKYDVLHDVFTAIMDVEARKMAPDTARAYMLELLADISAAVDATHDLGGGTTVTAGPGKITGSSTTTIRRAIIDAPD